MTITQLHNFKLYVHCFRVWPHAWILILIFVVFPFFISIHFVWFLFLFRFNYKIAYTTWVPSNAKWWLKPSDPPSFLPFGDAIRVQTCGAAVISGVLKNPSNSTCLLCSAFMMAHHSTMAGKIYEIASLLLTQMRVLIIQEMEIMIAMQWPIKSRFPFPRLMKKLILIVIIINSTKNQTASS